MPDAPIPFDNALGAIRTLNHFFYCLKHSKQAFLFKGKLAYHAGRPGASRDSVISILQERAAGHPDPLIMYYFYIAGTEAERTLTRFVLSPRVQNSSAKHCLKTFGIDPDEDELGLCHSPVSPLILVYDADSQEAFDRFGEVFFELPLEFVQRDNRPIGDEFSMKTVLVQQPEPDARRYWEDVATVLRKLKSKSEARFKDLDDRHISIPTQSLRT